MTEVTQVTDATEDTLATEVTEALEVKDASEEPSKITDDIGVPQLAKEPCVTELTEIPAKSVEAYSDSSYREPKEKKSSQVLTGLKMAAGAVVLGPALLASKLGDKVRDALSYRDDRDDRDREERIH